MIYSPFDPERTEILQVQHGTAFTGGPLQFQAVGSFARATTSTHELMLIKDDVIEKIQAGEITTLFRRWSRPGAKAGGSQMTQGGVIGIDTVEIVEPGEIADLDARDAGYASVEDLLEHLNYRDDPIDRIRVYFKGEDPRIALALQRTSLVLPSWKKLLRNLRSWMREVNAVHGQRSICS